MSNRDYTVKQGDNGLYIFGECKHCGEPQGIISSGNNKLPDEQRCFCRGANGLSFRIKCCYVLNCIKKQGHICNLIEAKSEYLPKEWNVLVVDIPKYKENEFSESLSEDKLHELIANKGDY